MCRLSCLAARGIFSAKGSSLCPLHWWVDSYPLDHQGSPLLPIFKNRVLSLFLFFFFKSHGFFLSFTLEVPTLTSMWMTFKFSFLVETCFLASVHIQASYRQLKPICIVFGPKLVILFYRTHFGKWHYDLHIHLSQKIGSLPKLTLCVCMWSVQLFATLWTVVRQAPLSMGFSRQDSFSRGSS